VPRATSLQLPLWDRVVDLLQGSKTLETPPSALVIGGGEGDDTLSGTLASTAETLFGYGGEDTLTADGNEDTAFGGTGNDQLYGGDTNGPFLNFARTWLYGDAGDDVIEGHYRAYGGAGNDTIHVEGEDSLIYPQVAAYGGDGDDRLVSAYGGVALFGGSGDDAMEMNLGIAGTPPNDPPVISITSLDGGAGDDVVRVDYRTAGQPIPQTDGGVVIDGGAGNDKVASYGLDAYVKGGAGDDVLAADGLSSLLGQSGGDDLQGAAGTQYLFGGSGADAIRGGGGGDWAYGDKGDDDVAGGAGYDRVFGGSGRDFVRGNNDNDVLYGGSGIDQLYGGNGDDVMYGGLGIDRLYGGAGRDNFVAEGTYAQGVDRVMDFNFAEGDRIDLTADLGNVNVEDLVGYGYLRTVAVEVNGQSFAAVEVDHDGRANGETFQRVMLIRTDQPEDLQGLDFWTISA
jgi:Ca2+-binding RTX toxin-like protein